MINGKYVEPHKLNDALEEGEENYDTSAARNFMVLDILNEDIGKIKVLCQEHQRDMPTEMKLIYDVRNGKFKAEYKYDLVYTHDDIKTASHIADEWFEEVKITSFNFVLVCDNEAVSASVSAYGNNMMRKYTNFRTIIDNKIIVTL